MAPTQLEIKTNALKRLLKEESLYKKEVLEQEQYVQTLKSKNVDAYELKKQIEVLNESERMVTEMMQKIETHKLSLSQYLATHNGDEDVAGAKALLS